MVFLRFSISYKLCIILVYLLLNVKVREAKEKLSLSDVSYSESLYTYEYYETKKIKPEQLDFLGKIKKSFHMVAVEKANQRNLVCSPVTVLFSMAKLSMGSSDKCQAQLFDAIGVKREKRIKSKFKKLIQGMRYLPGVTIDVANRIFASEKYRVLKKFKTKAKLIFKSGVETLNFDNPVQVAHEINKWVSSSTKGKINSIISRSDIPKDAALIVVTAIYFLGRWQYPFRSISPQLFISPFGSQTVPMMKTRQTYNYGMSGSLDSKVVEIPYVGGKATFLLVLPNQKNGLPRLIQTLKSNPDLLNYAISDMKIHEVELSMPMFKIETDLNLKNLLKDLQVTKIFDENSSGLKQIVELRNPKSGEQKRKEVYVSYVKQKAIIEVTQTGTSASAADAVVIVPVKGILAKKASVLADHPFLFYVKANKQQLFAGIFTGVD